ncbi:amidohydrolase, partial [Candidatus Bathyarchaeota archaeon]
MSEIVERLLPDLVIVNGKVLTVDKDFTVAEALAVKDGRIVAVGSNEEIRRLIGPRTEVIDAEGR